MTLALSAVVEALPSRKAGQQTRDELGSSYRCRHPTEMFFVRTVDRHRERQKDRTKRTGD